VKFKRIVRAWDTASSPPSQTNKNPDWTVGVKMGLSDEGYVYILDVIRFRDTIGKVKEEMRRTAHKDGVGVHVVVPLDPGGHGKHAFQDHVKNLSGYVVKKAKTEKSKLDRFLPFASQAEHGWVKVVQGEWNNAFYNELESFIGDGKKKDDQVDAVSDAYKELNSGFSAPTDFKLNLPAMSSENPWDI
jgi:predicted phage terminase large subunit-like protein